MSNSKKSKSILITGIVIMAILLLGILVLVVWDIVDRCRYGWTNNDTIQIVFFAIVAITGSVMIKTLQDYFVAKNKNVMFIKNDIYRLFKSMESNNSLSIYEQNLIEEDNARKLVKINKIINRKDHTIVVTFENLNDYFDEKYEIYKRDINIFSSNRLSDLYSEIKMNKSKIYEKMYSSIYSDEYIRIPKFPLFEFILPLLLGFVGIFVTIYEALSVNNPIKEPLIEYLKLFGATFFFALSYSLFTTRSRIEDEIIKNKNIFAKLSEANTKAVAKKKEIYQMVKRPN